MTREYSIDAPANGATANLSVGTFKFLLVKTITTLLQISFDGSNWITPYQNQLFQNLPNPSVVFARTMSGQIATIDFQVDNQPLQTQVTAQSTAKNYIRGNLGLANGFGGGGGKPVVNANGLIQLPIGTFYNLSGTDANGNRRQHIQIYFNYAVTLASPIVYDSPGNTCVILSESNSSWSEFTDSNLIISAIDIVAPGVSQVTIQETFLTTQQ